MTTYSSVNDNQKWTANTAQTVVSAAFGQSLPSRNEAVAAQLLKEGSVPGSQSREEIDAKIAASEARSETKIARLEGKMDILIEKVGASTTAIREDGRATRANIWAVGVGILLLIGALIAAFPAFFDMGGHVADLVEHAVKAAKP
jgi:hypothetical protein